MNPTCKTCRFWGIHATREEDIAEFRTDEEDARASCHRFPPHPNQNDEYGEAVWPFTYEYDFCGEHQPKQPQPSYRTPIDSLTISVRGRRILQRAGIRDAESLASMTEEQVLLLRNCGTYTLREYREFLASHGLRFKEEPSSQPDDATP